MEQALFGAFCLDIEKLTVGQFRDLRQRLRTLDATLAVVSKVDARSEAIRCCLYCKATGLQKWGATRSGLQRL